MFAPPGVSIPSPTWGLSHSEQPSGVGGCAVCCGNAARRPTVPNFFDLIPTDDGDPDELLLDPFDDSELDALFDRLERGDEDDEPEEEVTS